MSVPARKSTRRGSRSGTSRSASIRSRRWSSAPRGPWRGRN